MHTAVVKDVLLRDPGVLAEIRRRHSRKKGVQRTLHPNVYRERLDPVQTEQQGAVGNLHAHAGDPHQFFLRFLIGQAAAVFQNDLA